MTSFYSPQELSDSLLGEGGTRAGHGSGEVCRYLSFPSFLPVGFFEGMLEQESRAFRSFWIPAFAGMTTQRSPERGRDEGKRNSRLNIKDSKLKRFIVEECG